jgi:hypothetical protein
MSLTREPISAPSATNSTATPTRPPEPTGPAGSVEPAGRAVAPGDPLVAGALLTAAALFLTYQLLAGHVIPPLAVFGVLTAVLGLATLRRGSRWLLLLDALVAVLELLPSEGGTSSVCPF